MTPPDDTGLFRLVYRSRSTIAGDAEAVQQTIDAAVATSQRRNVQAGVTGTLMFTGLFFVQALEGAPAAVEAIFDRICCDLRHTSLEVIECGPVLEPGFGNGAMTYLVPDAVAGALLDRMGVEVELADAAAAAMRLMAALVRTGPRAIEPVQNVVAE
ncbi:BLUF domain-containing protein [Methylobacterium sp. WL64]|uniref:BLUF domain-containing protein n=1 Tax=Methylobacterium sp. WL64 TaxID=2603894 RepID=UPI0011C8A0B6|nr:BLUF domain-containing protein [Methylobacterium sp. WL64]TXM97612.1 BLUF domain-containing protein [Methylobacterium sp. WL64]